MRHKRKRLFSTVIFAVFCAVAGFSGQAQVLTPDIPANRSLILAVEQFEQEHYALAAQSSRRYIEATGGNARNDQEAERAKYIIIISGLKTDEPGCTQSAGAMMDETRNKAYEQRISFNLAQYYFKRDQYVKAIHFYEKAGLADLTNQEIADEKFELAYCYFNNKQFEKAEPLFAYIKELKDGKYYAAANYYYGLLCYNQNKLEQALASFEKVKDDKEYKNIVPYYVAEIYYFMGNRSKSLEETKAILEGREKNYYDNDLHLLAAQCLFEDQKYADAKPYFEYYYDHTEKIKKEDLYKMAYCYYRLNDWQNATEKFKLLSSEKDSLGQTSMYLLGDCYLKTGDKESARNAFGICADLEYNKGQQEASMMLYARISFEEGYNDDALDQLKTLLETFPKSQYTDEANTLISDLLLRTNNFEGALKYLEKVTNKNKDYRRVLQKAAYGNAVQLFRSGDLYSAFQNFAASVQHPEDLPYESAAYFWMGELGYRMHNYNDAIANSQEFLDRKINKKALAILTPQATAQHAYLNMGFAAMEMKDYSAAQSYFSRSMKENDDDDYSGMVAGLHEADAVFMQQNYVKAISLYDKIITTDTANADYARYQKSVILGLQGKNTEKIKVLLDIIGRVPPSDYAVTARYEAALTYIESDKYPLALTQLRFIVDSTNDKSEAPKAWLKIGFICQQTNDNPAAIAAYKNVVINYPASDERRAALDALKSLYIQNNEPGAYAQLLKEANLPSAENSSVDSTYYAAAETQFAAGKWDNATHSFSDYLKEFPNGLFAIKAHYYRGESYYQLKNFKAAQGDFDSVLANQWNDFSDNSARHAATIAYDDSNYTGSFNYYLKLRKNGPANEQVTQTAFAGLVKSGYRSEKYNETILYADSLLSRTGNPADLINETLLYKARSKQKTGGLDTALSIYKQLSDNQSGEAAAESRYHISEIYFRQDSLNLCEAAAKETISLSSGYEFWVVKSYLLLAEIFIKQKDYFNAKATLESIVKHTKIAGLKAEAAHRLDEVKAMEKPHSKLKTE